MRIRISQAARITGVHPRTIRRWVGDGDLLAWDDDDGLTLVDPDHVMTVRVEKTRNRIRNLSMPRDTPTA